MPSKELQRTGGRGEACWKKHTGKHTWIHNSLERGRRRKWAFWRIPTHFLACGMIQVHNYFRVVTLRSRCQQWSLEWHSKKEKRLFMLQVSPEINLPMTAFCLCLQVHQFREVDAEPNHHTAVEDRFQCTLQSSVFLEEWLILNSWRCILFPSEKGILLWFSLIDTGVAMHVVKTASICQKFQPMLMKN